MEIKITQCSTGRFNLLSNEESLSFYMGIYHDGKIVTDGEKKAQLHYSGEVDDVDFFSRALENLEGVFEKCFEYGNRIMSSTDYRGNCLFFAKVYSENYEAIDGALVAAHKEKTQKQIEKLQREMEWNTVVPDISDTINYVIDKEIKTYKRWLDSSVKDLEQTKEGTNNYETISKNIDSYKKKIEMFENSKIEIVTE